MLLRKTERRGRSAVPLIFRRSPRRMRFLFEIFVDAIFYYLAAVLPSLRRRTSPLKRIPLPLYGSGLRIERMRAAT